MQLRDYIKAYTTQKELAKELGVHQQTISHWVTGRRQVTVTLVLEIERLTGNRVTRHELRPDIYPIERPRRARDNGEAA